MKTPLIPIALMLALCTAPLAAQASQPIAPPQPETAMLDDPCAGRPADLYDPASDWAWLCRYHAANLALAGQSIETVFLGDSITEGWSYADPGLFVPGTVNRGISGQTSPQLLLRFMADVVALKPRVVHLMIGTNDVAGNTGPTSPQAYKDNVRAMAYLAKANGIVMVLGSIPPADRMTWRPDMKPAARIAELNAWLKTFAAERGLVFADYYAALAGPGGDLPAGYGPDGVHPNGAGYAVMRPIALAAVAEAAGRAAK
jgi:lysophospholipase L1-like esterase